jgi:hypothetical protein
MKRMALHECVVEFAPGKIRARNTKREHMLVAMPYEASEHSTVNPRP